MYEYGDIIQVKDEVSEEIREGIVVYVEIDSEIPDVLFIYYKSETESNNDKTDPRFENYWDIVVVPN